MGTIAIFITRRYETFRISAMRKAAAPRTGGEIIAPMPPAESLFQTLFGNLPCVLIMFVHTHLPQAGSWCTGLTRFDPYDERLTVGDQPFQAQAAVANHQSMVLVVGTPKPDLSDGPAYQDLS